MYRSTTLAHRRQRGMTVLEVAIVLGVLAIVAAFLFPYFARARETSGPNCLSNVKQLGLGMLQYAQDNDQRLPPRQSSVSGKRISWRQSLYPYLKSTGIYQCPKNPYAKLPDFERDGFHRSYAVDGTLGGAFGDDNPYLDTSKITSPTTAILLCESTSSFGDFDPLNPGFFAQEAQDDRDGGSMHMHEHGSNFLFCDGRAKWQNPLLTIGASVQEPRNNWTIDNRPFSLKDRKTAQYTLGYAIEHGPQY